MNEDYKGIPDQLSSRSQDRLEKYFKESDQGLAQFLLAKSDIGVCRNGGRRGAKYGPDAIINVFKKLADHLDKETTFNYSNVINDNCDDNFDELQKIEIENIKNSLSTKNSKNVIHIGGGHDHIYPLLKALETKHDKILVLNIDAHLDTRVDPLFHSGTPFRQFANETKKDFKLIQLGIHDFANAKSNYNELPGKGMDIYEQSLMKEWTKNFTESIGTYMNAITEDYSDYTFILSLDCDAISSDVMDAVSAVNHRGIPGHTVSEIFNWYKLRNQNQHYYGIYEYNPLFDTLSQKGARYLSALIYEVLTQN
ncbi:arginase family protein [Bacteriovorax sp. BSW11_IV]|uniref:arginase family protein n=1 Tax=Bacteriovorax sp. BSW11_IV TaxID=1353529 RepID=UPI00038A19E6|nr:arginase family protein [Bacteriovorax sp. BSW11_IV]EQC50221.1 arginase family protein [Bacteriovorax sp. BSW11_IV]